MKIKIILLFLLFLINIPLFSQTKNTIGIDTPTAYTLERGRYQVSFLGYDSGGVELKTFIGLHDNLFLGLSFDVQNAIGREKPVPNIPGVIARIKLTDGWPTFPIAFAIGYDSFYIGSVGKTENEYNKLNRMIYGPYLVLTNPIYLFDDEQYISYGIRLPTQPNYVPGDTSYFLSIDVPMGESFRFMLEGERVYWNFKRPEDWLFNFGIRYTYLDQLGVEVDFMFQRKEKPNRIIKIIYNDEF